MARKTDVKTWVYPGERVFRILGVTSPELNAALENWAYVMQRAIAGIESQFTRGEWCYVADMLNGHISTPAIDCGQTLAASVLDSVPDGLPEKWQVDAEALAAKLTALDYVTAWAVINRCQFFWREHERISLANGEWWRAGFRLQS